MMMTGLVRRLRRLALSLVAVAAFGAVFSNSACDRGGVCGDGVKNAGEECDGEDIGGATCQDLGFQNGELSCYYNCTYIRTDCTTCGNDHKELREDCDGPNLGGQTCETLGYYGGTLGCYGHCEFDLSDCEPNGWCGDGTVNGDEDCEDNNNTPWDGCTDCSFSEFRVHIDPEEHGYSPALAVDHDGAFVAVWVGGVREEERTTQGVYGRLYRSDAGATGAEFMLSGPPDMPYAGDAYRSEPDVAGSGAGRFVVVWQMNVSDTYFEPGLYGRILNEQGAPVGIEFRIDQSHAFPAERPKVAMADDGRFAVVWQAYGQDSEGVGIVARLFDSQGVPTTNVMHVNSTEIGDQVNPNIAMSAAGGFTVVWQKMDVGSFSDAISAQWFDSAGTHLGPEVEISDDGFYPAVDTTPDGTTMFVWTEADATLSYYCLWAQTFDSSAMALDPGVLIDEHPDRAYGGKRIALRNDGSAAITWAARAAGSSDNDVFFQLLDASGNLLGSAQQTHTYRDHDQDTPDIGTDAAGGFVVTWQSLLQDEHAHGIYAQRYDAAGTPLGLSSSH